MKTNIDGAPQRSAAERNLNSHLVREQKLLFQVLKIFVHRNVCEFAYQWAQNLNTWNDGV